MPPALWTSSSPQSKKIVLGDPRLRDDRPNRTLGQFARMVGGGCASLRQGVRPDFVGAGRVAAELEAESAQAVYNLAVAKTARRPTKG